jgi:hypothetical protein
MADLSSSPSMVETPPVRSMAAGAVTHERNADRYLGSSMPMLVRAMGRFRVIVIMILHPLHVVQVTVVML